MPVPYLLVSNPPHGDVDVTILAEAFELSAAEARIRANFPSPEIWFAEEDVEALKKTGGTLMKAGAKVRIIKGSMLTAIPRADQMTSFTFGPDRFTTQLHSADEFSAPYDTRLVIVSSKPQANPTLGMERPKPQLGHMSGGELRDKFGIGGIISEGSPEDAMVRVSGMHDIVEDAWFLDLYFVVQSKVRRIRAWCGGVDYAGLETELKPAANQNHGELLTRLRQRFQAAFDERLVDTPAPKPTAISGMGLQALLESIDPDLKGVGMGDLHSRLVFLSVL